VKTPGKSKEKLSVGWKGSRKPPPPPPPGKKPPPSDQLVVPNRAPCPKPPPPLGRVFTTTHPTPPFHKRKAPGVHSAPLGPYKKFPPTLWTPARPPHNKQMWPRGEKENLGKKNVSHPHIILWSPAFGITWFQNPVLGRGTPPPIFSKGESRPHRPPKSPPPQLVGKRNFFPAPSRGGGKKKTPWPGASPPPRYSKFARPAPPPFAGPTFFSSPAGGRELSSTEPPRPAVAVLVCSRCRFC